MNEFSLAGQLHNAIQHANRLAAEAKRQAEESAKRTAERNERRWQADGTLPTRVLKTLPTDPKEGVTLRELGEKLQMTTQEGRKQISATLCALKNRRKSVDCKGSIRNRIYWRKA